MIAVVYHELRPTGVVTRITHARTREKAALLRSKAMLYLVAKRRSGAVETFEVSAPAPISNNTRLNQATFSKQYQRLAFRKGVPQPAVRVQ